MSTCYSLLITAISPIPHSNLALLCDCASRRQVMECTRFDCYFPRRSAVCMSLGLSARISQKPQVDGL